MVKTKSLVLAFMMLAVSQASNAQGNDTPDQPQGHGAVQVPWSSQMQPGAQQSEIPPSQGQNQAPPSQVPWPRASAPTLGQVLDQEGQANQPATQQWSNTNWQQAPGSQQGGMIPSRSIDGSWGVNRSSVGGLIDNLRGMVKDMVNVDLSRETPSVKVRAPFVNVDVDQGQPNVKVDAPFVHVNKAPNQTPSVQAPFVNMSMPQPYPTAP